MNRLESIRRINERVDRAVERYIVTGEPVRILCKSFGVSKSTIHRDIRYRAANRVDGFTYEKVCKRARKNSEIPFKQCTNTKLGLDYDCDVASYDPDSYGLSIDDYEVDEPEYLDEHLDDINDNEYIPNYSFDDDELPY